VVSGHTGVGSVAVSRGVRQGLRILRLVGIPIHFATGLSQVMLGVLMLRVLLLRPAGLTGGRELQLSHRRLPRTRTPGQSQALEVVITTPRIDTKEGHATR
jgi:hypothetical protein